MLSGCGEMGGRPRDLRVLGCQHLLHVQTKLTIHCSSSFVPGCLLSILLRKAVFTSCPCSCGPHHLFPLGRKLFGWKGEMLQTLLTACDVESRTFVCAVTEGFRKEQVCCCFSMNRGVCQTGQQFEIPFQKVAGANRT